jgi:hypothetical protein
MSILTEYNKKKLEWLKTTVKKATTLAELEALNDEYDMTMLMFDEKVNVDSLKKTINKEFKLAIKRIKGKRDAKIY